MAKNSVIAILITACTVMLISCEPGQDNFPQRQFVTKEGEHYSQPRIVQMLQSDRLVFDATFNESAIYDFDDRALQTNKNKLMGFADCNSQHHENSARFAWQWFDNRLEIYAYCYVDGVRREEFVDVISIHERNRFEIRLTRHEYVFFLNGLQKATITRSEKVCNRGVYYMLFPYFGGSVAAPHDISIDVAVRY